MALGGRVKWCGVKIENEELAIGSFKDPAFTSYFSPVSADLSYMIQRHNLYFSDFSENKM